MSADFRCAAAKCSLSRMQVATFICRFSKCFCTARRRCAVCSRVHRQRGRQPAQGRGARQPQRCRLARLRGGRGPRHRPLCGKGPHLSCHSTMGELLPIVNGDAVVEPFSLQQCSHKLIDDITPKWCRWPAASVTSGRRNRRRTTTTNTVWAASGNCWPVCLRTRLAARPPRAARREARLSSLLQRRLLGACHFVDALHQISLFDAAVFQKLRAECSAFNLVMLL